MGRPKKEKDFDEFKSYNYCAVLYPLEDPSHASALEYIRANYDAAEITHDMDEDKTHTHVVWRFGSQRYRSAVADEIGIKANYLQKCGKLNSYLRYLIHKDDPDKFQYSSDKVTGSLRPAFLKAVQDEKSEDERFLALIELIESLDSVMTMTQLVKLACSHGFYSDLRRAGYIVKSILEDHNNDIRLKYGTLKKG